MAEYIDREKLLVAFESKEGAKILHHSIMDLLNIQDFINAQEKADVVEVVRCNDCKFCERLTNGNIWCKKHKVFMAMKPNDFCSYGELKEREDK